MENVDKADAPEWARPVEAALLALLDAIDAASLTVCRALRTQNPPDHDLRRFSERFESAQTELSGLLLDVLAPEAADIDAGGATALGDSGRGDANANPEGR